MKRTLLMASLAIGLIMASCGSSSETEENRTDSAGVINESTDTASGNLDQNGVLQSADSTIHADSSMKDKDVPKK